MAKRRIVFIYTTDGDLAAYLIYPYIFDRMGDWIGWVTKSKEVYSVLGHYVGYLAAGPRVLRKKTYGFDKPQRTPPEPPGHISVPAYAPLAPLMPELPFSEIDIFQDEPMKLHPIDAGELRQDLD